MGKDTGIAWCHHTFNPWWGCTKVSEGCRNCYAETLAKRWNFDVWGDGKTRRTFGAHHWGEPLTWDRAARKAAERRRVFCGSMCDVCDQAATPIDLDALNRTIRATTMLDWLLLTKRPCNFKSVLCGDVINSTRAWLGTTIESPLVLSRLDALRDCPASVRFISAEPLLADLGAVDLTGIGWVIVGCESGPHARPMQEAWVRSLRDRCIQAGVPLFYKQAMGGMGGGKLDHLPAIDGRVWRQFPVVSP